MRVIKLFNITLHWPHEIKVYLVLF